MLIDLQYALLITVMGMGLVFGIILLIWLMMTILVKFTQNSIKKDHHLPKKNENYIYMKKCAAAVAVVIALARSHAMEPHPFPLPPTASVSAWQALNRTEMLHKHRKVR